MKGFLIAQGWTLEKTHSIAKLLTLCITHSQDFAQFEEPLVPLNRYITEARYPADIDIDFSLEEAQPAVEVTERVQGFVHQQLAT